MMKLNRITRINLFISMLLVATLYACNTTIEKKIGSKIEKDCGSDSECVISMKTVTDFEWNKLYVFSPSAKFEDINKALGFSYPYYKEFSRILVFTNNGKIAYHEENSSNIEHLEDKEVVFNYSDSLRYAVYTADHAVFKSKTNSIEDGVYYELTPIK